MLAVFCLGILADVFELRMNGGLLFPLTNLRLETAPGLPKASNVRNDGKPTGIRSGVAREPGLAWAAGEW